MPVSRMRMRPWLEMKINSSAISGLVWVDKKEKIFSIPWKHAARHGWEVEKDASLFKEWAIHTGKFTEGQTTADPKTWKANFRCAMNSLPDIEEVKDKSVNKGHQAVRVYRMLKATAKPRDGRSKVKDAKRRSKSSKIKEEEMECSDADSPADHHMQLNEDTPSPQENTVDSTEHQEAPFANTFDVPEWSTSIEIGPDSTSVLYPKFQVSPEHSPEYSDATEDIIKIAQQLELDTRWMQYGTDNKGFLINETCTDSYSDSSPGSQWSDTSSADEVDLPLYTDLGCGLPTSVEDLWNGSYADSWNIHDHSSFLRQIAAPL